MTFEQLVQYLNAHSGYAVLDGDPTQTVAKARGGNHSDALMGEILKHLYEGTGCGDVQAAITRAQATTSLGPLRLRYMKDDAPVAGFRMVEKIIHTIDGAFNDEALREKLSK
jgi:hypothetical protein